MSKACPPPAARPAWCSGPGSGWTSPTGLGYSRGLFPPSATDFRSRIQAPPTSPFRVSRQPTPTPETPASGPHLPPTPQASKRVHLSLLARSSAVKRGGSQAPRLASRRSPTQDPCARPWSPHLPQRRLVPLLLEALVPVVGKVRAEAPEAVELLALPRRALTRVQHPSVQRQPAAPKKRAEHGPGPRRAPGHGSQLPASCGSPD